MELQQGIHGQPREDNSGLTIAKTTREQFLITKIPDETLITKIMMHKLGIENKMVWGIVHACAKVCYSLLTDFSLQKTRRNSCKVYFIQTRGKCQCGNKVLNKYSYCPYCGIEIEIV